MTTEEFLTVFSTFFYDCNKVTEKIYCDNGSNFVGAANVLNKKYELLENEFPNPQLSDFLNDEKTQKVINDKLDSKIEFHFGKPRTPHSFGFIEAFVKLFKTCFYRVISPFSKEIQKVDKLNNNQLREVLARIGYALNSRPLTPLSTDVRDYSFITPNHFLTTPIKQTDMNNPTSLRSIFDETQKLTKTYTDEIWRIWKLLYLPSLLERQKWLVDVKTYQIGDLVLYKTKEIFNKNYPLGRVVKLISGSDGIVRHLEIKTEVGTTITIPVHHTARLEADSDI